MKIINAIISSLLIANSVSLYGINNPEDEPESVQVEIYKSKIDWTSDIERSEPYCCIQAYAFPSNGMVEVFLHNIGSATVYLFNCNNQVICTERVQTDDPTIVYLNAFTTEGVFHLVIISASWYAEGEVSF